MILAEIERAEKRMQQQWYDLVMAEQQGDSLEVLEQMYDTYILLAEEYNRCCEAFQRENLATVRSAPAPKRKGTRINSSSHESEGHIKLAS